MRGASQRIWSSLVLLALLALVLAAATAPAQSATGKWKKNISVEFHDAKWSQVIEWLADQADLNLVTKTFPKGTFSFTPPKRSDGKPVKYALPEIIDILNESLHKQKWTILRTPTTIYVWPAGEKIPVNAAFFNLINKKELDDYGNTEVVSLYVTVKLGNPEQIALEMKKILGPFGEAVLLPTNGQIWLRGRVGALKLALAAVSCEAPKESAFVYHCQAIRPAYLEQQLKKRLPGIKVLPTEHADQLVISGSPAQIAKAKSILKQLDLPVDGSFYPGAYILKQYNLPNANAAELANALQETWKKKSPNVLIKAIGPTAVMVYASPTDQAAIAKQLAVCELLEALFSRPVSHLKK